MADDAVLVCQADVLVISAHIENAYNTEHTLNRYVMCRYLITRWFAEFLGLDALFLVVM